MQKVRKRFSEASFPLGVTRASVRSIFLLVAYTIGLIGSRYLAYQLRFDGDVPPRFTEQLAHHWMWVIPVKLIFLAFFGQFAGLLGYFSVPDLRRLLYACLTSSLVLLGIHYRFLSFYGDPRGVP